jgi:hypothetical protein
MSTYLITLADGCTALQLVLTQRSGEAYPPLQHFVHRGDAGRPDLVV